MIYIHLSLISDYVLMKGSSRDLLYLCGIYINDIYIGNTKYILGYFAVYIY